MVSNIMIRGARTHNLKNLTLRLPKEKLIVVTGVSGSGKSSLVFDTLYVEGYRRYVESISTYARQFLSRSKQPDIDSIEGICPSIAIRQHKYSSSPRSTIGTKTELVDFFRLLYARIGRIYDPKTEKEQIRHTPLTVCESLEDKLSTDERFIVGFPLGETSLENLNNEGISRVFHIPTEKTIEINDFLKNQDSQINDGSYFAVVDRRKKKGYLSDDQRLIESVALCFRYGQKECIVYCIRSKRIFRYCQCIVIDGKEIEELFPQWFSFNEPLGACPNCHGLGTVYHLDKSRIINSSFSLKRHAITPFNTSVGLKYYHSLMAWAKQKRISIDISYQELSEDTKYKIWCGDGSYKGIHQFFLELENMKYNVSSRHLLGRYKGSVRCPDCQGSRLNNRTQWVRIGGYHLGEILEMTIDELGLFFKGLSLSEYEKKIASSLIEAITDRLAYMKQVGIGYLTLDRSMRSLSGGEYQRIQLALALGNSLVGSLYVLDEPTMGLHSQDTHRLIEVLREITNLGNTVIVVEHDAEVMRHADHIIDIGPLSGEEGGKIVFEGKYDQLCRKTTLTGQYLSGKIAYPKSYRSGSKDYIELLGARTHNLKQLNVRFPLRRCVCITGVSGSGKSSLIVDTLYLALLNKLGGLTKKQGIYQGIDIQGEISEVEMVDQNRLGKNSRSNVATYIKVFDSIRELFSRTKKATLQGIPASHFSSNVPGGRCDTCMGEGENVVEMQFLADVKLICEECGGKRYKPEILDCTYQGNTILDVLDMHISEAVSFFENVPSIVRRLTPLVDIGLGYLRLGQKSATLSGGEAQRLRLVDHLAKPLDKPTLFIFDEPTTGLHFDDINKLLHIFEKLLNNGHSIILIEHHLDVIQYADWIIDMGPGGGLSGGYIVAEGPPEVVAQNANSCTGAFLRKK